MAAPTPSDIAQGVPAGAEIATRVAAPGGGEYLLDKNGGVYAIGGAQYMGSYFDDQYLDPVHRNDPNRQFYDLRLKEGGGYELFSDRGNYDLSGTWQAKQRAAAEAAAAQQAAEANANSLYSDPAYLAFIRNSDLGIETVANQIARQNAALQSALGLDIARRENQGIEEREGIYKNYASRGIARSGGRMVDTNRQQLAQTDDIASMNARTASEMAGNHERLASAVADRMRQAGELGLSTGQQQDLERRNEELRQKYPTEYGYGD